MVDQDTTLQKAQLTYPLDADSLKALSKALDQLLPGKLFDIFWNNMVHVPTLLTAPTGTADGTGSVTAVAGSYKLLTDGTSGHTARLQITNDQAEFFSLLNRSNFRSSVSFLSGSANPGDGFTGYLVYGSLNDEYYGFKFIRHASGDGTLVDVYGCSNDNASGEKTVLITTTAFADQIDVEARYLPSQKLFTFIVFGTKTATLHAPSVGPSANTSYLDAKIITNAAHTATLFVGYYDVLNSLVAS